MLLDIEGFVIPFAGDDQFIECGVDDPDFGPAESWPAWTVAERFEPSSDDESWFIRQSADDDDWAGYAEWSRRLEELHQASEYMDHLEAMHWTDGDQDIMAAGLPVG
jgi:hypothetical protein